MLTPILLVGPPGSGKSRMVRRLAELLQLPFLNIAVGGSHDSKVLMGTSRGWSTGMPTPLLTPLLQHKTASALVLLDELDKPGSGNEGPSAITSVLLGLMEPETAARYRDPFLLTSCNLSRLIYVGTANSLQMPKPLLSRFTVVLVPEPRPQDRAALAQSMLNDVAKDMGVDHRLMPEIPSELSDGFSGNARAFKSVLIRFLHDWAMEQLGPGRAH
jgi:ATP-dependent Lon protease